MTTQPPDDFLDLTAFALGELDATESARVKKYLASSPAARAEYVRIEHAIAAMKRGASLPKLTLTKRQRETVLAVGQPPVRSKVVAFPGTATRRSSPVLTILKFAAAACLAIGAFFLGQRTATPSKAELAVIDDSSEPQTVDAPESLVAQQPQQPAPEPSLETTPAPVQPEPQKAVPKAEVAANPAAAQPSPASSPANAEPAAASVHAPSPAIVQTSPAPAPRAAPTLKGFRLVATKPETSVLFQPKLVKTVPQLFADKVIFAAPMPLSAKPAAPEAHKKTEALPLVIHSSRAEIASCPWDSSRRLMRLVVQVPVDQPAVEVPETDYKLIAKFDPFQVQGYRLVAEKHLPPSGGSGLATRFAWYEILPTKNFAPTSAKPITLGTFEIVQPKASRDSAPLRLVDRGTSWTEAREDYVFETAMIGFSLLLKGTENVGDLNHKLVLEIAEKSKGEDPKGERAKFIKAVQQARKAAGL